MMLRTAPLLVALLALGITAHVHAALRNLEQAYELDLGQVTLPAATGGNLTLRRCTGCAAETLRVDAHSEFHVLPGPGSVGLDILRREAARRSNRPRTSLFVYFDPGTRVVRRIVLDATQ